MTTINDNVCIEFVFPPPHYHPQQSAATSESR